jgi:hypothetical protein
MGFVEKVHEADSKSVKAVMIDERSTKLDLCFTCRLSFDDDDDAFPP